MKQEFENDFIMLWIEDGLIFGEYKPGILTESSCRIIVRDRIKFQNGKSYPCVADITRLKYGDQSARKYLATDEANQGIIAGAVLVSSHVMKVLANFYLNINKPNVPAKLFTDRENAISWVSQFKNYPKNNP